MKIYFCEDHYLPHQWQFINDWSRTLGLIGGLGSGKTAAFLAKTFICHISRPGATGRSNVGVGYPSYGDAKELFFYPYCDMLDMAGIKYVENKSELTIKTEQGQVKIVSVFHPERIKGFSFTDFGFDEIDTLDLEKGKIAIRRARERLRGRRDAQLFMVSSPEGFSTCYDVLKKNPNPGTSVIHADTRSNTYLPAEYINDLLSTYDEQMAMAYIEGQFVNLNNMSAHYAFKRAVHVHAVPKPDLGDVILVGIDFNVNPMTAALCYTREIDGRTHYFFFAEYYLLNANTYLLSDLLAEDYPNRVLRCYPDPTGIARKTSSDASDIEILKRKGFDVRYRHGITQRRSLNIANGAFAHNAIHIDPSCENLINDLEQVVTDAAGAIIKPNGTMLTHISDAMRNIIVVDALVKQEQTPWDVA